MKDRKDPDYGMRLNDHIEVFAGAPAYKAPELLSNKPIYSEKSDVFAFSIVIWEMLTTIWTGTYVNSLVDSLFRDASNIFLGTVLPIQIFPIDNKSKKQLYLDNGLH